MVLSEAATYGRGGFMFWHPATWFGHGLEPILMQEPKSQSSKLMVPRRWRLDPIILVEVGPIGK